MPINAGHQGFANLPVRPPRPAAGDDLGALLAKALLLFTLDVEATSPVPLVHSANILRVLRDGPVDKKELPTATGVARETLGVMSGQLLKQGLIGRSPDNKAFALTSVGRRAAAEATTAVAAVEARWPRDLRVQLEPLAGDGTVEGSLLAAAIRPPAGTWRSRHSRPKTLPHHPVVSHRGGFPDGS
jgi:hypothetical protein